MNISGISPYAGQAFPALSAADQKQDTKNELTGQGAAGKAGGLETPEVSLAISKMREDRVLQQYQYFVGAEGVPAVTGPRDELEDFKI